VQQLENGCELTFSGQVSGSAALTILHESQRASAQQHAHSILAIIHDSEHERRDAIRRGVAVICAGVQ
jgi:hypothetical protein